MDASGANDWKHRVEKSLVPFASSFGAEDELAFNLLTYHLPGCRLEEPLQTDGGVFPLHGAMEGVSIGVIGNAPAGVDPIYIMSNGQAWLSCGQRQALSSVGEEQQITQEHVPCVDRTAYCSDACSGEEQLDHSKSSNRAMDTILPDG
jgi:hypothetical protein